MNYHHESLKLFSHPSMKNGESPETRQPGEYHHKRRVFSNPQRSLVKKKLRHALCEHFTVLFLDDDFVEHPRAVRAVNGRREANLAMARFGGDRP